MNKILPIILVVLFSGNSFAEAIYRCNLSGNLNGEFIITVNDYKKALFSMDNIQGILDAESIIHYGAHRTGTFKKIGAKTKAWSLVSLSYDDDSFLDALIFTLKHRWDVYRVYIDLAPRDRIEGKAPIRLSGSHPSIHKSSGTCKIN